MKPIEIEISQLKAHHNQMWDLVMSQVRKSYTAFENNDKDLAREVVARERMVNAQELVVDYHCENFIALFNPVAIDLRFVISLMKINNNLERIGDFAESIGNFVLFNQTKPLDAEFAKSIQIKKMMDTTLKMMDMAYDAILHEDSTKAGRVLALDDIVDQINRASVKIIADYGVLHTEMINELLHLYGVIRRIERVGDRSSNIAEDVMFYVDAKEMRHRGKQ